MYLRKTELFEIEMFWYLTVCKQKQHLYETELFEIELLVYMKMDLALNNLQRLMCHKAKTYIQTFIKMTQ